MSAHYKRCSMVLPLALLFVCVCDAWAFTPHTDHSLMNASSAAIVIDIHSSAQDIRRFLAVPGGGITFDGIFLHLTVHTTSGRVLSFDSQQLRQLHGGTIPSSGGWLFEDSGLRLATSRQFMLAYRRFHKLWP
jgi:hypothetical protein